MNKNITLSADESLIKKARMRAQKENQSLNEVFREWLNRYVAQYSKEYNYEEIMNQLSYARPGGKFTRNEMNER